jgi:hypothetical protein
VKAPHAVRNGVVLVGSSIVRRTLAVLGVAVLATLGMAQSELDPPDFEQYLRWGIVRARPGILFSDIGYDSNILVTPESDQVGDYTATISPKLDGLILLGSRNYIEFLGRLDYKAYANNPDQNFLNSELATRLMVPFPSRRIGIYTDLGYRIAYTRPVDLERARPEGRNGNVGLGVILEPGPKTRVEIARVYDDWRYIDNDPDRVEDLPTIGDRLDRNEQGTRLNVAYRAFGRTSFLFRGLWKDIEFDSPFEIADETISRDTREWRLTGGISFGRGGPLVGEFLVGWTRIRPDSSQLSTLSTLVGEASLSLKVNPRTRIELEGERLPGFAVFGANAYYLYSNVWLRGVYYLTRIVGLEAGRAYGRLTFPASLDLLGREDTLNRYQLGVRFRMMENSIGRRVEYALRFTHYDRTSTVPIVDRTVNTLGFNAVLGF